MFNIQKLIASLLGRKDNRTIEKLPAQYPELTKFISQFQTDTLEAYAAIGSMGSLDYFLKMNAEELLLAKEKLSLLNGRSIEELGEMIKMGNGGGSKMEEHILFNAYAKLNSFYGKKMDGEGLKRILEQSLVRIEGSTFLPGENKSAILDSIGSYETSLKRLEAAKHKDIIIGYIKDNLSELECELIINDVKKG